MSVEDPRALLGLSPSAPGFLALLSQLSELSSTDVPTPEIKAYSNALYMNYFALGLSFMFISKGGTKRITADDVNGDSLILDSIDLYNVLKSVRTPAVSESASASRVYSCYPAPSLNFTLSRPKGDAHAEEISFGLAPASTGKDIVGRLGEPDRKGGGAGPSSGSIGIWCEWSQDGILVEFGGEESRGPKAWEQGKDAKWKVLTLFRPKDA